MADTYYPEPVERAIAQFSRLPGIGRRTAERLVFAILDWSEVDTADFARAVESLQTEVHPCARCGNLAAEDLCGICHDPRRDPHQICVVEDATQIPVIEKASCFHGRYHVLGGRLAPLEGVGPEELNIDRLHRRIEREQVTELIIATGSDVEGEATAAYLIDEFGSSELSITRIASGIPVGADLSYADAATIAIAMNKRSRVK